MLNRGFVRLCLSGVLQLYPCHPQFPPPHNPHPYPSSFYLLELFSAASLRERTAPATLRAFNTRLADIYSTVYFVAPRNIRVLSFGGLGSSSLIPPIIRSPSVSLPAWKYKERTGTIAAGSPRPIDGNHGTNAARRETRTARDAADPRGPRD